MPKRKMREPEEFHVRLKLTGEMAERFEAVKQKHQFAANTDLVRMLINKEYFDILGGTFPLEHLNTYEDRVLIRDRKLNRIITLNVRPWGENGFTLHCEHCDTMNCEHVLFATTVPKVLKPLEEQGWVYKGEYGEEEE